MARLGELTDEQTPLLRDLQRAAPGAERDASPRLGPFSEASRPAFRSLGEASRQAARGRSATSADEIDELRQLAADAPRARQAAAPVPADARRPQPRPARTRAPPRRAPPAPDPTSIANSERTALHRRWSRSSTTSTGRRSRSTSSTRSRHFLRVLLVVGSECAPYANAEQAQGQGAPRALQLLARPVPAGRHRARPDRGRRAPTALAARTAEEGRASGAAPASPRRRPMPGQPDPSQAAGRAAARPPGAARRLAAAAGDAAPGAPRACRAAPSDAAADARRPTSSSTSSSAP